MHYHLVTYQWGSRLVIDSVLDRADAERLLAHIADSNKYNGQELRAELEVCEKDDCRPQR